MQLVVIAKQPRPGFSKTRLCPPCTPEGAAAIAEAALVDTLSAVAATAASRRVLILDGDTGPWLPPGFDVVAQVEGGLGNRLAAGIDACFAASDEPVVLVGMDTPQLRPEHLLAAAALLAPSHGSSLPKVIGGLDEPDRSDGRGGERDVAVLGPATDGGFWLIGLHHLHPAAFCDVGMSENDTFARQTDQLIRCGYRVRTTTVLDDVDLAADAIAVARMVPGSRFDHAVRTHLTGESHPQ